MWYYLIQRWEDKGVHIFLKGICSKVNEIEQMEFELASYISTVQHFNHYITRTPHHQPDKLVLNICQEEIQEKVTEQKIFDCFQ